MNSKKALEVMDRLIERTPYCTEEGCRDALIIARGALAAEIRAKDCMKCGACLFYKASDVYGLGTCSYKGRNEKMFEEDLCSRGEPKADGEPKRETKAEETIDAAIVDLRTPLRPDNLNEDTWNCPRCGSNFETEDNYRYCPCCSQAIDWSEYEGTET